MAARGEGTSETVRLREFHERLWIISQETAH
jgi:hypothetical protein